MAGAAAVVGAVLAGGACATHQAERADKLATLTAAPAAPRTCAPNQLTHCIPGLADVAGTPFGDVGVFEPSSQFEFMPPGAESDSAPEVCQDLPKPGVKDGPALDVQYRFAEDTHRVYAQDPVVLRLSAAGNGETVERDVAAWAGQCPMWSLAPTMDGAGVHGWMIATSAEALRRYQAGDITRRWSSIIHIAARTLPNGVIAQAWYRTGDPSASSRSGLLSRVLDAVGQPLPRSAFPPTLAAWNRAQIATLLPPLALQSGISTTAGDPNGPFWSLCPSVSHPPGYDTLASWHSFDQSKWDSAGKPLRPFVTIHRARPSVDHLTELRRDIADCTARLAEKPVLCANRDNHQSLQADSVLTDGADTVRFTHRWLRDGDARGFPVCSEGVEAMRVSQLGDLLIISSAGTGGYLFKGDPPLPLDTLDELQAETVRRIHAA